MAAFSAGPSHGPMGWREENMFIDSRTNGVIGYGGGGPNGNLLIQHTSPSTSSVPITSKCYVKWGRATPDGGALSLHKELGKLAVVGRETIRILTIGDEEKSKEKQQQHSAHAAPSLSSSSSQPSGRSVGPGGAFVEASPNYWPHGRLRAMNLLTDVAWGPEAFSNKVYTSCSTGEVHIWDFSRPGLRLESNLPGGVRSVNVVTSATFSPYSLATGSADGSVKLWDLRATRTAAFSLGSHGAAVRSLTFGQTNIYPIHVVLGLESGNIFRYDLRMRIEYLDRIVAHTQCVHDLAWQPPSKDDTCAGYLASASFDHTVKIWQIESTRMLPKPLHTLHTPYPVGKVGWRPSFETEIVVLPYHSGAAVTKSSSNATSQRSDPNERFAPQIWDVRKGWLAKWQLPSADGPATGGPILATPSTVFETPDCNVTDANTIQVMHKSGAFIQQDLRDATRPADEITRQSLSWNANSALFFVGDRPRPYDPPYDDLHPAFAPLLADFGMVDKRPGDRLAVTTSQVAGMQLIDSEMDRESYMQLARGYNHHHSNKVEMCKRNEEVATAAGEHDIAQTWALLGSLLTEYRQKKEEDLPPPLSSLLPPVTPASVMDVTQHSTTRSQYHVRLNEPRSASKSSLKSPLVGPQQPSQGTGEDIPPLFMHENGGGLNGSLPRRKGSSAGVNMLLSSSHMSSSSQQKRRESSPSLLSALRPPNRSSSSSPASGLKKLPHLPDVSSSFRFGSMINRPHLARRMSISSNGNSHSPIGPNGGGAVATSEGKPGWNSYTDVAEGALEDSSSEEEEGEGDNPDSDGALVQSEASVNSSWSREKRAVASMGIQHPTLHSSSSSSAKSSPSIGGKRMLGQNNSYLGTPHLSGGPNSSIRSSPQMQLLDIQDVTEDDDEDSEEIDGDDDDGHRSAESLLMRHSGSSEDDYEGGNGLDASLGGGDMTANAKLSPPSPTLAKYVAAKSTDSSRTTTISRTAGLRVLTKQDSASSMATAYQAAASSSLNIPSSFGSASITPTMTTIPIRNLPRREGTDQSIATIKDFSAFGVAPMTMTTTTAAAAVASAMGAGGTAGEGSGRKANASRPPGGSPLVKPASLRNLFDGMDSSQSLLTTPTTAGSGSANPPPSMQTQVLPPTSAGRPQIPRNTSFGSKPNRVGAYGTVTSGSAYPGSAGPHQDSFVLSDGRGESIVRSDGLSDELVEKLEKEQREAMFGIVKDSLEMYAEEAPLAMAAGDVLDIEPERLESFVNAYVDQLMRMRLHLNAAYVRRSAPVTSLNEATATDTFFDAKCGRCGRILDAAGPPETKGRYSLCTRCKKNPVSCSICHLPVRKMLFICHGCGHGGHQHCYQEFYVKHPPVNLVAPRGKFPFTRHDGQPPPLPPPVVQLRSRVRTHSLERGVNSEEDTLVDGSASPAPRGRRRDTNRRTASDIDSPEIILEKETTRNGQPVVLSREGSHKRSVSTAEVSTIMDEESKIPDEEYIQVREREAEEREGAREDLRLLAHPCAAGCGHFCWMARN
ncbi:hypothetical protein FRC17_009079 [Serendipita sp. 399]|nr:hypothetical protein FRC17_009079 [Serendipita sp. 399]